MNNSEENETSAASDSSQLDSDSDIGIPSKIHNCTYDGCGKSFHRPSKLANHLRRHTEERPFKCEHSNCEKTFYIKQHLKRHQQKFHLKKIENAMCPIEGCLQVMRKNSMQKHMLRKHNSLRKYKFQCEDCGEGVKSELELRQHTSEHSDVFRCNICDKVFQKGYRFQAHLKTHEKKYTCGCQQPFDFNTYQQHKKICRDSTFSSELRCELCQKVFSTKFNLKQHQETHLESQPRFECSYEGCSRRYNQRKNLTQHVRTFHLKLGNGDALWTCDVCQKKFKMKRYLTKHQKIFHESPIPPTTNTKVRKPRCDKGIPKIPMITILTGLEYHEEETESKIAQGKELQKKSVLADSYQEPINADA